MFEKCLRNFAEENFGDKDGKCFPVYYGRTQEVKPFAVMVKKTRSIWKRPFKKHSYLVLGGMEMYVVTNEKEAFQDAVNKNIKNDDPDIKLGDLDEDDDEGDDEEDNEGPPPGNALEAGLGATCGVPGVAKGNANVKIKIDEELGKLELGKIDQEYLVDAELRDILANTTLDSVKAKAFEGYQLRLVTSVIYSERFELKGPRGRQFQTGMNAEVEISNAVIAQLKSDFKKKTIPPKVATRNTRGPFLFKCCRVVYNTETNKLELAKGEVIGKPVHRGTEEEDKEEYENTAVDLEEDEQSDLADAYEDGKTWGKIINSVLKPTKNREERKARVNKYLQWFVTALTKNQKTLTFDQPLNEQDCEFVRHGIFTSCLNGTREVNLPKSFDEDKIQGYAIVLKKIAGLSDDDWDEVEKAWAEEA